MKLSTSFVLLSVFVSTALSAPLVQQVGSALGAGGTSSQVQDNDYSQVQPGNSVQNGGGASASNEGTAGTVSQFAPSSSGGWTKRDTFPVPHHVEQIGLVHTEDELQAIAKRLVGPLAGATKGLPVPLAGRDSSPSQGVAKRLVGPLAGATKGLPVPLAGRDSPPSQDVAKRLVGPAGSLTGLGAARFAEPQSVSKRLVGSQGGSAQGYGGSSTAVQDNDYSDVAPGNSVQNGGGAAASNVGTGGSVEQFGPSSFGYGKRDEVHLSPEEHELIDAVIREYFRRDLDRRTRYQGGSVEGHGGSAHTAQDNDVSQVAPGNQVSVGGSQTADLSGIAGGLLQQQ
ncbi:uncharacterized protein PFL1_01512 [Pseudozyma flocculosa PF-1]|uniref:Secreted protein n=1 Tax=Pseudozyma flocculosa TaxID=84751 RepID=A0A5C3FBH5_9BASI|nr:uncharacterized protein PFL1_01512 [Pseudozyma flocculosa PF-1]EPQ31328.1 hypothetical protein PFL1_01512 [Pseudozyma flocculosa PF-1]SPO41793.1 uncharacterized protein PSFLO_07275 [Pseudozyma flocculosa]